MERVSNVKLRILAPGFRSNLTVVGPAGGKGLLKRKEKSVERR